MILFSPEAQMSFHEKSQLSGNRPPSGSQLWEEKSFRLNF